MALVEHSSHWIGEGVDSGSVDGTQSETAIHRAHQHGFACFNVLTVLDGTKQVAGYELDAIACIHIDGWMGKLVGKDFDAVSQGIHTGFGSDTCRHTNGQSGVKVCHISKKVVGDDTFLSIVTLIEEDSIGRNFAARPRRSRHTGKPYSTFLDKADAEAFFDGLFGMEEGGDKFGNIHHRATTDTEHRVGFELLCLGEDALEVGHRGFTQDLCLDKNLDTIGSKSLNVRLQNWHNRIGSDEQEMVETHLDIVIAEMIQAS